MIHEHSPTDRIPSQVCEERGFQISPCFKTCLMCVLGEYLLVVTKNDD